MNTKNEWENRIALIVARSNEKMQDMIKEKDEYESKARELLNILKEEQRTRDTLKENLQNLQNEIAHQLKLKLEYQIQFAKKTEASEKLNEGINKMKLKINDCNTSFDQTLTSTITTNKNNEERRNEALNKDIMELNTLARDKDRLLKEKEELEIQLEELQVNYMQYRFY